MANNRYSNAFERYLQRLWPDRGGSCLRKEPLKIADHFDFDLQVIIPIYNVAPYLRECLDSVFTQQSSYRICVTMVDDGSTDESGDIAEMYATQHAEAVVIHQPNQGLSAARNAGLEFLRAPRVYFLDSDDLLASPQALHHLLQRSIESGADMTDGSMIHFDNQGQAFKQSIQVDSFASEKLFGYACNKIFRAEVFRDVQFPLGYLFEDTLLSVVLFWHFKRWASTSTITYRYRSNEQGLSQRYQKSFRIIEAHWVTRQLLLDYVALGGDLSDEFKSCMNLEFRSTLRQIRHLGRPDVWLCALCDMVLLRHHLF